MLEAPSWGGTAVCSTALQRRVWIAAARGPVHVLPLAPASADQLSVPELCCCLQRGVGGLPAEPAGHGCSSALLTCPLLQLVPIQTAPNSMPCAAPCGRATSRT